MASGAHDLDRTPSALPALVLGCVLVGASSTFIKLSGTTAHTAAFYRCALALLVLAPVVLVEYRRYGRPPAPLPRLATASGVLLGADYLMWTQSILDAGAAVATVLIGVQVVVFPLLAWLVSREQVHRRFLVALPVMLAGLVLTGGVLDADPHAPHPIRGAILGIAAGVCYAGYLLLVRRASGAERRMVVTPVAFGTASAAAVIGVVGVASRDLAIGLDAPAWAWLIAVAVCGQALSFALINYGSVRLSAARAAAIMLLQPVAAIVLGVAVLHEHPTLSQYLGMAITITAIALATVGTKARPRPGRPSAGPISRTARPATGILVRRP
ncbi:drug/metabolite transporter (DMT)-like permease [Nocardia transvalensis]|uniref:Drug/metabolite transporter (DMT)-like permease n=1 Tax=Nocardia transvalensis TaxID=37333 RepID=A0A7W9PJI6_9NOCA|nr:DMT family transporter [Nocardia transvalensis]MBB5917336.1 drug/metabolite transporter (DMT)-like permease [Nocardia transvalensis]